MKSIIWIVVLKLHIWIVTYMDLKFELYESIVWIFVIIDSFPTTFYLSMLYLIIFHKLVILRKCVVNFCLFYKVLVFDLVQFIVSCWLDYVKNNLVWFSFEV